MRRIRYRRGLLLSLVLLFIAVLFALYSETALRWTVSLLSERVPSLSIAQADGRLAGPFTLSGIAYTDAERHFSLEMLTVDWKPSALLAATAHVTILSGRGLQYEQQPGESEVTSNKEQIKLPSIQLPLALKLDSAMIDGITLRLPGQDEPVNVTQLSLRGETQRKTLVIHTMQLNSDWLMLDVKGNIRPVRNYDLNLALSWRVPQQDMQPWQGEGRLQGNLKKLELTQHLVSPVAASLSLEVYRLLEALTWEGRLNVPQLKSSQLPFSITPAFTVGGEFGAAGTMEGFNISGNFAGKVETVGHVEGKLDAKYQDKRLHLTRLLLARKNDPAKVEASGEIVPGTPLSYRLEMKWQALGWPFQAPDIYSGNGRFTVSGDEEHYRFDTELLLAGPQIPEGTWRLKGHGSTVAAMIDALNGELLNGTVSGKAVIKLSPNVSWEGQLQGRALNPGVKWMQWPGRISLDTALSGEITESGPVVGVSVSALEGVLRERTLQGDVEFEWLKTRASFKHLNLKIGTARLQAQGELSDESSFAWQLHAAKLADLWPQTQGSLKADGQVSGKLTAPKVALRMEGTAISFDAFSTSQVDANINIDLHEDSPSDIQLRLAQLKLPGMPQQSVSLKAEGPLSAHRLNIESLDDRQSLILEATAGLAEQRWAGTLGRLQIEEKASGQWQLAQEASFSLTKSDFHLDEVCLNHMDASLCLGAAWSSGSGLHAALRSVRFPLRLLASYLPQRIGVDGELNGKAEVAVVPAQPPQLSAGLTIGSGRLHLLHPESETELMSLPFQTVDLQLSTSDEGRLDGNLSLLLNQNDKVLLTLSTSLADGLPDSFTQHPLSAQLRVTLRELAFVSGLLPEVQNFEGAFDANVTLSGSLDSPQLSGYAKLDEAQLDIPGLGLTFSDLALAATGNNTDRMEMVGKAHSGDGDMTLTGHLSPEKKHGWLVTLALTGDHFTVANIPEARMQVSPDLTMRMVGREIHLEGKLDIPSARLEPPDLSLAVKPSDDVVILGEEEERAESELWLIHTRLQVTAADSIRFIGYGFDGRIGGELLLIDEPGSVTRGRGVLQVVPGSSYEAFGTKLSIERGLLSFADSPADNPNLDIKASRTIGDVVAGVNVSGTAKSPLLTLYSEPPMDQADILSYLTLGHPVSSADANEGKVLAGAANSAGLVGGNYLAGYFGRQFGLEEFRVEAGQNAQSPWLVVGKYLSPRLYVRYGVGVYEDAYSVIVRYRLSEHWQVQGEGGRNSGADILYTFERP